MSFHDGILAEINARTENEPALTGQLASAEADFGKFNLGYNWSRHIAPNIPTETPIGDALKTILDRVIESGDIEAEVDEVALGAMLALYVDRKGR